MKRVLISQSEKNNGTDYLVVDGVLINDEDSLIKYGRLISKTDDWKEKYKDDFLEIKNNKKQLLLKSTYMDKDTSGRSIYYLYIVEETDDYNTILDLLQQDSQLIKRTFDREKIDKLIKSIEDNNFTKNKINKYILLAIGVSLLIYLLTK